MGAIVNLADAKAKRDGGYEVMCCHCQKPITRVGGKGYAEVLSRNALHPECSDAKFYEYDEAVKTLEALEALMSMDGGGV